MPSFKRSGATYVNVLLWQLTQKTLGNQAESSSEREKERTDVVRKNGASLRMVGRGSLRKEVSCHGSHVASSLPPITGLK